MKTSQKILITGFPHCGTTILKSVIGHIDDVEEIYNETDFINIISKKKFILCKWPFIKEKFFDKIYEDYIKIFIIRNPLFVFSSLNKRFENTDYKIKGWINDYYIYIRTLKKFIKYKTNPVKNIYTIKYEDLFKDNFKELKKILDNIGFNYNETIFDNNKYNNISHEGVKLVDKKPNDTNHETFRTWQINQSFISKNDFSKIYLTNNQKEKLINNPYVLHLYLDEIKDYKSWNI